MAQVVPLNWSGSYCTYGGPIAPGQSGYFYARYGDWGQINRFYLFQAFTDGTVDADVQVQNVSLHQRPDPSQPGGVYGETLFEIHVNSAPQPVMVYCYIAWSDPINV
jgi:hypothetical protein